MHTVLVLGGYGFFGHRICASLAGDPSIRLLVGGRHRDRALETVQRLGLGTAQALAIDANHCDFARLLKESEAEILIHTAGPFQHQDYRVARAAIEAGCHYIDLADGRQFVAGITALDEAARKRGVFVISGASSVPALSSAVVDRYRPRFARLESIELAISSGARAPGLATVQGIFGYAGHPFHYWSKGEWTTAHGWLSLRRHRFPPPLGARWLCHCDIPDLALFPNRYSDVTTVSFEAGFAGDLGHLVVWALARLVKARTLPSAIPFAAPLNRLSRWIEPLVSDKGGMFVRLKGLGHDGNPFRITWTLVAQDNHGPHVPCGAAVALTQKLCGNVRLPSGAMPCMGLLSVEEYLAALPGLNLREIVE
ncbi:MAG TPA: saccharopine dehydrogenase NADP-binding domain-containing protein [Steroidobacteraceae bacterium]|nr:saccharopine dehydrogenase NADP-binding domain-containing protein [Steroidobacteraceae bacterium]